MKLEDFPELIKIEQLMNKHHVKVHAIEPAEYLGSKQDYKAARLAVGTKSYKVFVDHEYQDLDKEVDLLTFYLILRELEFFDESHDFIEWYKECIIEPLEEIKKYYEKLEQTYDELQHLFGNIDSFLSPMDFELNAGAVQFLRSL